MILLSVTIHMFQWHETKLKMGLNSTHPVYQGCNSKLRNKLKTLWTKWIAKKNGSELQLDLLFAQDDQTPVTIHILESDTSVRSPNMGQMRLEIVAPQAFNQITSQQDVETHLYHARGLDLGKITRNGFHLGFFYEGTCLIISSVRVYYMKCPELTVNQTSFGVTLAGSDWIRGECVDGAEEVSTPKIKCESNGHWGAMQGFCVCGAGYQTEGNTCKGQSMFAGSSLLNIYAYESFECVINRTSIPSQSKLVSSFAYHHWVPCAVWMFLPLTLAA